MYGIRCCPWNKLSSLPGTAFLQLVRAWLPSTSFAELGQSDLRVPAPSLLINHLMGFVTLCSELKWEVKGVTRLKLVAHLFLLESEIPSLSQEMFKSSPSLSTHTYTHTSIMSSYCNLAFQINATTRFYSIFPHFYICKSLL